MARPRKPRKDDLETGAKRASGITPPDTAPTQPKLPENKFPVVVKNKGGRPDEYSPYIAGIICNRLIEGESLRAICRDPNIPAATTIFDWMVRHPEFDRQYTRAMEQRTETHIEQILEIADDGSNDTYTDEEGRVRVDYDNIQRSKLRVDTRKWIASKLKPRKYGEKVVQEVTGANGGPIQSANITINASDLGPDAREAIRQALLLAKPKAEVEGDDV